MKTADGGLELWLLTRRPLNNFIGGVNVKNSDVKDEVPANVIEALARCLLPAIRSYFESEEGQAAFEEWKSQRDAKPPWVPAEKKQAS